MEPILNPLEECPVCLIDIKTEKTKKLDCGHIFHEHCIEKWIAFQNGAPHRIKPSCPTCRIIIPKQEEEHQTSCFGFCFYYRHRNR